MKKLTVGSLKYGHVGNRRIVNEPEFIKHSNKIGNSSGIDIKQNDRVFQLEVKKGQSILEAALEQNIPLDYKCTKGTCGKCRVQIVNGQKEFQQANDLELKKLQDTIQNGYRLACQAIAK